MKKNESLYERDEGFMEHEISIKRRMSSFQLITLGFLAVILTGSVLLMLPISTQSGESASFIDALFTATSATCVTGLIVHDTATYWSVFGQAVILIMIQIGGMGVVTIAVFVAVISGRKIGLMQRSTMQEAIQAHTVGGIVRLTGFILKTTVCIELLGAVLLYLVFGKEFGTLQGLWYALFHSISAFCNAGFDLMGQREAFSSLTWYQENGLVNLVIMGLIIIGGIGFLTWDDIRWKGLHFRKYRMQSKVILLTTALLIIFPFLFFYFGEFGRETWEGMGTMERFWSALFQTVTPRTAGFNTVDLSKFSESGQTITILLMLIGGSPGSTAGGMKTTTIAVLTITLFAVFRRKSYSECFGRRIDENAIKNAAVVMMMYITLFLFGGIVISWIEQLPMLPCLFETASAIGTVGLTLGITPKLGVVSHLILTALMFMGRVGGLTLVFAAVSDKEKHLSKLPKEKITVG